MAATRARMRWQRWEHPDWWLGICAGLAWAVLLIGAVGDFTAGGARALVSTAGEEPAAMMGHHHGIAATGVAGLDIVALLLGWSLMVVAMMLPWAAPEARWLAHRSLGRRRTRTVFLYVAGFLGSWFLAGWAATAMVALTGGGTLVAVALIAAAAIWHILPVRRRALRRCGTGRLPAIRGVRADADCVASGVRSARRCIVTCGIAMMAMAALHNIVLMAVVTAINGSERRRGPNPEERIGRVREAFALGATASALLVAATAGLV